ncbi:uncharacterized protein LOC117334636 [Pecten maximus]|uniref:uncharacterized protein LOC117334636 n=1 Tax=Pecten maximus TaxID=6579 RepID=UPI001458F3BF|nr:uncharacterized protein LOC117334636 [Pecten maximus]
MLWASVIAVAVSAVVAQDFYHDRTYGVGVMPSRDRLYGSQRRVMDRTYQETHGINGHNPHVQDRQFIDPIDTGYGQTRTRKVIHKPVVDTGYIAPKPMHTGNMKPNSNQYIQPKLISPVDPGYVEPKGHLGTGYVKSVPHGQLDTGYVKHKLVDTFDASYVPTKPIGPIDGGYVNPIKGTLVDPLRDSVLDTGYVKPVPHGQLDTGYVKPKLVDPLDAAYVPAKPLGPIDSGYIGPKLPVDAQYVKPKVTSPLDPGYVGTKGTKLLGPGDVGYVAPGPFGGKIVDPIKGHGRGHQGPIGPFGGARVKGPGISTSDFVAVDEPALPVSGNVFREPSLDSLPRGSLGQGHFPEQRRLPSDIRLSGPTGQRNNRPFIENNRPFIEGVSHGQQHMLTRPLEPIPPPMAEKKIAMKKTGRSDAEKRSYYQKLRNFDG